MNPHASLSSAAGATIAGEQVTDVSILVPRDVVRFDHHKVFDLSHQLGMRAAEDVVCRAIEDVAARLAYIAQLSPHASLCDLRKSTRGLIAIAEQVGMSTLAMVARDVVGCIDAGNGVALAATHERLMRVGDMSLSVLWESQDQSL